MKILAGIPVERIQLSGGTYTYRCEIHDVNVVRVTRSQATRNKSLNRWHYTAHIADHPALLLEAKLHSFDGCHIVGIQRRGLNNTWAPPNFGAGNVYTVPVIRPVSLESPLR